MILNFGFYLTIAILLTGIISLVDLLFIKKGHLQKTKVSFLVEYSKVFFPVLLIVWIVQSFIIQPYHVPRTSLELTVIVMPGDFIAVEQFAYGVCLRVINKKILPIGELKQDQIVLFRWPENPVIFFVKCLIRLPSDHIIYKNKELFYIDAKKQSQKFLCTVNDRNSWSYQRLLYVIKKKILTVLNIKSMCNQPAGGKTENYNLVLPYGTLFYDW